MNKKIWIWVIVAIVLTAVLFFPFHHSQLDDGGTTVYGALTYKIINWKTLFRDPELLGTRVYLFPDNFKSTEQLWEQDRAKLQPQFYAWVLEYTDSWVLVEPFEGESERQSCDRISFGTEGLEDIDIQVGSAVVVTYDGLIMESYPAQIIPSSWRVATQISPEQETEPA